MRSKVRPVQAALTVSLQAHECDAPRPRGFRTGWRHPPGTIVESASGGNRRLRTEAGETVAEAGEILVVPEHLRHELVAEPRSRMTSTWLHLQWLRGGIPLRFPRQVHRLPKGLGRPLRKVAQLPRGHRTLQDEATLQQAAATILLGLLQREAPPPPWDSRIEAAMGFLQANLDRPIGRPDIARAAGLSESRLHDLFVATLGCAPVRQLHSLRLQRAAARLVATTDSVEQVAFACGFRSLFYFSRAFRKAYGMPPTAFRAQQRAAAGSGATGTG